jgi:hypothetical protein
MGNSKATHFEIFVALVLTISHQLVIVQASLRHTLKLKLESAHLIFTRMCSVKIYRLPAKQEVLLSVKHVKFCNQTTMEE